MPIRPYGWSSEQCDNTKGSKGHLSGRHRHERRKPAYLTKTVRGAEPKEERAEGSRKDQTTSMGEMNAESRHVAMLN